MAEPFISNADLWCLSAVSNVYWNICFVARFHCFVLLSFCHNGTSKQPIFPKVVLAIAYFYLFSIPWTMLSWTQWWKHAIYCVGCYSRLQTILWTIKWTWQYIFNKSEIMICLNNQPCKRKPYQLRLSEIIFN